MVDVIKLKRTELSKKRVELLIDELEIRKLDLQVELEKMDLQIIKAKEEVLSKDKEIEEVKKQ